MNGPFQIVSFQSGTETRTILTGRERSALRTAREKGFLELGRTASDALLRCYGLWCWRIRIPLVWFERRTPRSRYGRLRLQMLTTAAVLSRRGQEELGALRAGENATFACNISAHDACWDYVPMNEIASLARRAFRAATTPENRSFPAMAARERAISAQA